MAKEHYEGDPRDEWTHGERYKLYVDAIHEPPVTLRTSHCAALRDSLRKGDDFEIETLVFSDVTQTQERKRVYSTIDGVYPSGIRVKFYHKNWQGKILLYRWLSYVQIILDRRAGNIPFANVGCKGY